MLPDQTCFQSGLMKLLHAISKSPNFGHQLLPCCLQPDLVFSYLLVDYAFVLNKHERDLKMIPETNQTLLENFAQFAACVTKIS